MKALALRLLNDDAGFIVTSELILIGTICVLALIVGLSELSYGVNQELEDMGSAVGSMNQSYIFSGFTGFKGRMVGSAFGDDRDECDLETDIVCDTGAAPEGRYGDNNTRPDYAY